jgi:hypothetical protein
MIEKQDAFLYLLLLFCPGSKPNDYLLFPVESETLSKYPCSSPTVNIRIISTDISYPRPIGNVRGTVTESVIYLGTGFV